MILGSLGLPAPEERAEQQLGIAPLTAAAAFAPVGTALTSGIFSLWGKSQEEELLDKQRAMLAQKARLEAAAQLKSQQAAQAAQATSLSAQARKQQFTGLALAGGAAVAVTGMLLYFAFRRPKRR